jgi:single stranded DNA-binding protein
VALGSLLSSSTIAEAGLRFNPQGVPLAFGSVPRGRSPAWSCVRAIHTTKEAPVATSNINRVVLTGNLTADPELRSLPSGTSVCRLRVAVNTRRKDSATGEYVDKPNYFDVVVWGAQGEACARYLAKGRPIAIDGHLEWREWQVDGGAKRQAVEVIAEPSRPRKWSSPSTASSRHDPASTRSTISSRSSLADRTRSRTSGRNRPATQTAMASGSRTA